MRFKSLWIWLIILLLVFVTSTIGLAQPKGIGLDREVADLVLHNATIYTMDESNPVASSIAIKDGKILAVGHRRDTAKVTGPGTEIINLKKATVIPGLIDSHLHHGLSDAEWREQNLFLPHGITSVQVVNKETYENIQKWIDLYEDGTLKVRQNQSVHTNTAYEMGGPIIGLFDDRLSFRSIKVHSDHTLGARRAHLIEPYSDYTVTENDLVAFADYHDYQEVGEPYYGPMGKESTWLEYYGYPDYTQTLIDMIEMGFQVRTHAIGDYSNYVVLNHYEEAMDYHGVTGEEIRPVIEHCQIVTPEDRERYGELGVIANIQAVHLTYDMLDLGFPGYGERWAEERLGEDRYANRAYQWRGFLDAGTIIAGSSDYAVYRHINPFHGLHAAVTGQTYGGQPLIYNTEYEAGYPEGGFQPNQYLTREEALKSYTIWAAYTSFEEDIKGSLEPGKLADLIVIDRDIMKVAVGDIWKTEVLITILGGEIVYQKE